MFPIKDSNPNALDQSVVMYKVNCLSFEAENIGKTTRILGHRINEHKFKPESAAQRPSGRLRPRPNSRHSRHSYEAQRQIATAHHHPRSIT
jgi:hypothetical protein